MSLRGDMGKLVELRRQLQIVRGPQTRVRLAKAMGNAALTQLKNGFMRGQDPYGAAWRPLKRNRKRNRKAGGIGKPLLDTGRMRSSFALNADANGFTLWSKTKYAKFHQYGTAGHSKDFVRYAPVSKKGRFLSHKRAAKAKVSNRARRLNFKTGNGAIPQRAMVPLKSRGLGLWRGPMEVAARRVMLSVFQRII